MAGDGTAPTRLVNFVSEEQLDEARRTRGERVEDGTAQRDRPLFEILKENKDKQDAEFNERFKHRPPKALDEDETEFLDKLETSQKEYERKMAYEEALELQRFQAAVAEKSMLVHELKEEPASTTYIQESKGKRAKNQLLGIAIEVKPQAKKAKLDSSISKNHSEGGCHRPASEVLPPMNTSSGGGGVVLPSVNASSGSAADKRLKPLTEVETKVDKPVDVVKTSLVFYSDESDEE